MTSQGLSKKTQTPAEMYFPSPFIKETAVTK